MGKAKGLAFLIGGIVATQIAAYELRAPHLGDLCRDVIEAVGDSNAIGAVGSAMWDFFTEYSRDFFYNKFSALGTAGQASMYGGLGNLIYNTIKRPGKEEEPTEEPK